MSDRILASIGTTHPWNVAGIGIDMRVAIEYGMRHALVIAGVSAQDADRVHAVLPIPTRIVQAQLDALPIDISALRIGALISSENVRTVAAFVQDRSHVATVVDPVLGSSGGDALWTSASYIDDLRKQLLTLPIVATPNLDETALLLQTKAPANNEEMRLGARSLLARGLTAVLITGGHLPGDPQDVLATRTTERVFTAPRLAGEMRGTGCVLAAALACELALGRELLDAVENAREYVRQKIAAGTRFGPLQTAF
ncbi:MAG TPA: bifunctional hydroxymethylpyrimidine kinase/phosphomethylpyrimidine kinase [Candidatus Rubrimentiphilum sp.]|nr:bifunctional hydroxymethylpyrimidine kinase/phosphomethylpyrimidine kinase [Candidatus Rubrimentiphilum sp.]